MKRRNAVFAASIMLGAAKKGAATRILGAGRHMCVLPVEY
jgi:hypothetical protein